MKEFVSAYQPRRRVAVSFEGTETVTKQSFAKECDINYIVHRWKNGGVIPKVTALEAIYGDVTGVDFQAALELVRGAEDAFIGLPAQVRKRFNNDPGEFLTFCDDPANVDELVELGLATRRQADDLARTPAAEPAAGTESAPSVE